MRQIVLLVLLLLILGVKTVTAQMSVSGRVVSDSGRVPIAGATITVKNAKTSTVSDVDGNFTIAAPSKSSLIISYVGFRTVTVPSGSGPLTVSMISNENTLSEVVVVGYGQALKKDITSSVVKVKGADIANIPVPNFTQALQGRAAGVFVESNNGKVGEGVKVRIRGASSISASNDPLYVIDGIPVNNTPMSGNPLADINFNDIESFDILKDAAATAIYGSRGGNGVVLITTKKGKSGKTNFQVNTQYGMNKPTHLRGFLNAKEYVDLLREAAINSDLALGYDPTDPANYPDSYLEYAEQTLDQISGYADWRKGTINTNWEKQAFNDDARTAAIDVSASGGNEKTRFYLSGSINDQDGILIGNNFKRISGRINLDHNVSSKLKIGANLSLSQTTSGRVADDNDFSTPMQIVALSPVTPIRDEQGNLYNEPVTTYANPMVDNEFGHFLSKTYRNIGNLNGTYKILPFLSFTSEFGLDIQDQNDDQFYGVQTVNGGGTNGYGESDWFRSTNFTTNNYLTFNKGFGLKHDLSATLGTAYQQYNSEQAEIYGQDFPVDALQKLASAGEITGGTSFSSNATFLSYFARINYKFADKYLLGLSGRTDGSSRFGADRRYGFFPAVSVGWILSEEKFLQQSDVISLLKLRGSWGLSGNAEGFGDFASRSLWGGVRYGGTSGLSTTQLGNPDLRWEKSKQIDIGIDFGFLRNRITGEIDYYAKKTSDLIYRVPVPANSGFTSQFQNVGAMENKGVEFTLNTQNVVSGNVKWTSGFNVSFNKNKVLRLDGDQTIIPGNDGRYLNSLLVGQSIGVFYGPKFAGVDRQNGDALYYESDGVKKTNDYNSAGNFVVGNPNPNIIAGLNNSVSFKGIELSVLFQGVFGNQIMNGAGGFMSSSFDYFDNQTREQLDRWKKKGDITQVPQLRLLGGNGTGASSRYVYDGDYIRVKNITLAYTLPNAGLRRLGINALRVYVSAVNLFTFTDYPGWDPEVNTDYRTGESINRNQGADFYAAPQIKNITAGINLGF